MSYIHIELPEREAKILELLKQSPQSVQSLQSKFNFHGIPEYIRRLKARGLTIITHYIKAPNSPSGRVAQYHLMDDIEGDYNLVGGC